MGECVCVCVESARQTTSLCDDKTFHTTVPPYVNVDAVLISHLYTRVCAPTSTQSHFGAHANPRIHFTSADLYIRVCISHAYVDVCVCVCVLAIVCSESSKLRICLKCIANYDACAGVCLHVCVCVRERKDCEEIANKTGARVRASFD